MLERTKRTKLVIVITVSIASLVTAGRAAAGSSAAPIRHPSAGPAWGTYRWPVSGPVIRGFEPPPDPYGPGHRGIDIAAPFGTTVGAAQDGIVAFAGWVGGSLFISIDHPDGVRTTYSWLSGVQVKRGQSVVRGQPIGLSGHGHPEIATPHLHFGARVGATYIDPMLLLERGSVAGLIHLAPLQSGTVPAAGWPGPWARPLQWPDVGEQERGVGEASSRVGDRRGPCRAVRCGGGPAW